MCVATVVKEKMAAAEKERDGVQDTRARTQIEIEEEINKGNPFSPDIAFHTAAIGIHPSQTQCTSLLSPHRIYAE